jgi:hypothetical protein
VRDERLQTARLAADTHGYTDGAIDCWRSDFGQCPLEWRKVTATGRGCYCLALVTTPSEWRFERDIRNSTFIRQTNLPLRGPIRETHRIEVIAALRYALK